MYTHPRKIINALMLNTPELRSSYLSGPHEDVAEVDVGDPFNFPGMALRGRMTGHAATHAVA